MRRGAAAVLAAAVLALGACSDDATGVVFEVIEDVTFDPSLNVDLAAMTKLPSGMYIEDLAVGGGNVIAHGSVVTTAYTGWRRTGAQFDTGTYQYDYGINNNRTPIQGWVIGMEGMAVGGIRRLIIPPELAYGSNGPLAGAVLVFRVEVMAVGGP